MTNDQEITTSGKHQNPATSQTTNEEEYETKLDPHEVLGGLFEFPEFQEYHPDKKLEVIDDVIKDSILDRHDFDGKTPTTETSRYWQETARARGLARLIARHGPDRFQRGWDAIDAEEPDDLQGYPMVFRDRDSLNDLNDVFGGRAINFDISKDQEDFMDMDARPRSGHTSFKLNAGDGFEDGINVSFIAHPTRDIALIRTPQDVGGFYHEFHGRIPENGKEWMKLFSEKMPKKFDAADGDLTDKFIRYGLMDWWGLSEGGAKTAKLAGREMLGEFERTKANMKGTAESLLAETYSGRMGVDYALRHTIRDDGNVVPMTDKEEAKLRARAENVIDHYEGSAYDMSEDFNLGQWRGATTIESVMLKLHLDDLDTQDMTVTGRWAERALRPDEPPVSDAEDENYWERYRFVPDNVPAATGKKEGDTLSKGETMRLRMAQAGGGKTAHILEVYNKKKDTEAAIDDAIGMNVADDVWSRKKSKIRKAQNFTIDAAGMTGQTAPMVLAAAAGSVPTAVGLGIAISGSGHFSETFDAVFPDNLAGGMTLHEAVNNSMEAAKQSAMAATPMDVVGDIAFARYLGGFSALTKKLGPATSRKAAVHMSEMMSKAAGTTLTGSARKQFIAQLAGQFSSEFAGELTRASVADAYRFLPDGFHKNAKGALYEGALAILSTAGNATVSNAANSILSDVQDNRDMKRLMVRSKDWAAFKSMSRTERMAHIKQEGELAKELHASAPEMIWTDEGAEQRASNLPPARGKVVGERPEAPVIDHQPTTVNKPISRAHDKFKQEVSPSPEEVEVVNGANEELSVGDVITIEGSPEVLRIVGAESQHVAGGRKSLDGDLESLQEGQAVEEAGATEEAATEETFISIKAVDTNGAEVDLSPADLQSASLVIRNPQVGEATTPQTIAEERAAVEAALLETEADPIQEAIDQEDARLGKEETGPTEEEQAEIDAAQPTGEQSNESESIGIYNSPTVPLNESDRTTASMQGNVIYGNKVAESRGVAIKGRPVTLRQALDESNAMSNPMVAAAANVLGPEGLDNTPVFDADLNGRAYGSHHATTPTVENVTGFESIFVDREASASPAWYKSTVGHETVHSVMLRALREGANGNTEIQEAIDGLTVLADSVAATIEGAEGAQMTSNALFLAQTQITNATGTERVQEFLAHAINTPAFTNWLRTHDANGTKIPPSKTKTKSMARKVADWIMKVLTGGRVDGSKAKEVENAVDRAFGLTTTMFDAMKDSAVKGRGYVTETNAHRAADALGLSRADYEVKHHNGRFGLYVRPNVVHNVSPREVMATEDLMMANVYSAGFGALHVNPETKTTSPWTGYAPGESTIPMVPFKRESPTHAFLTSVYTQERHMRNLMNEGIQLYVNGAQDAGIWTTMMEERNGKAVNWGEMYEQMTGNFAELQKRQQKRGQYARFYEGRNNPRYQALLSARRKGMEFTVKAGERTIDSEWVTEDGDHQTVSFASPKATSFMGQFIQQEVNKAKTPILPSTRPMMEMYGPKAEKNIIFVNKEFQADKGETYYSIDEKRHAESLESAKESPNEFRRLTGLPAVVQKANDRRNAINKAYGSIRRIFEDEMSALGYSEAVTKEIWNERIYRHDYRDSANTSADATLSGMRKDYRRAVKQLERLAIRPDSSFAEAKTSAVLAFERLAKDDGARAFNYLIGGLSTDNFVIEPVFPPEFSSRIPVQSKPPRYIEALRHNGDAYAVLARMTNYKSAVLPKTAGYASSELMGVQDGSGYMASKRYVSKFYQGFRDGLFNGVMDGKIPQGLAVPLLTGMKIPESRTYLDPSLAGKDLYEAFIVPALDSIADTINEETGLSLPVGELGKLKSELRTQHEWSREKTAERLAERGGETLSNLIADQVRMVGPKDEHRSMNASHLNQHIDYRGLGALAAQESSGRFNWEGLYSEYARAVNTGGMLSDVNSRKDLQDEAGWDKVATPMHEKEAIRPERTEDREYNEDMRQLRTRAIYELSGRDMSRAAELATMLMIDANSKGQKVEKAMDDQIFQSLRDRATRDAMNRSADTLTDAARVISKETGIDAKSIEGGLATAGAQMMTVGSLAATLDNGESDGVRDLAVWLTKNLPAIPVVVADGRMIEGALQGEGSVFDGSGVTKFGSDANPLFALDLHALSSNGKRANPWSNRVDTIMNAIGKVFENTVATTTRGQEVVKALSTMQASLDQHIDNGLASMKSLHPAHTAEYAKVAELLDEMREGGTFATMLPGVFALKALTDTKFRTALQYIPNSAAVNMNIPTTEWNRIVRRVLNSDATGRVNLIGSSVNIDADRGAAMVDDFELRSERSKEVDPLEFAMKLEEITSFEELKLEEDGLLGLNERAAFYDDEAKFAKNVLFQAMNVVRLSAEDASSAQTTPDSGHSLTTPQSAVDGAMTSVSNQAHKLGPRHKVIENATSPERRAEAEHMYGPAAGHLLEAGDMVSGMEVEQRNAEEHLPSVPPVTERAPEEVDTDQELNMLNMAAAGNGGVFDGVFFKDVVEFNESARHHRARLAARSFWQSSLIPPEVRDEIEASEFSMKWLNSTVMRQLEDVAFDLMDPARPASYRNSRRKRARAVYGLNPDSVGVVSELNWKNLLDAWRESKSFRIANDFNSGTIGQLNNIIVDGQKKLLMGNSDIMKWIGAESKSVTSKVLDLQVLMEYGVDDLQGFQGFKAQNAEMVEQLDQTIGSMVGEDASIIQITGLLGSRGVGSNAHTSLRSQWSEIVNGQENVRNNMGSKNVSQRMKSHFATHDVTINKLRPTVERTLKIMEDLDFQQEALGLSDAFVTNAMEDAYSALQDELSSMLSPEQAAFRAHWTAWFREIRPAMEINSSYTGKPMGVFEKYWPMDGSRLDGVTQELSSPKYREVGGKVGTGRQREANTRHDGSSGAYLGNFDAFSAVRRAIASSLFALNTTQSGFLMHDLIGTEDNDGSTQAEGTILRMMQGAITSGIGQPLGVVGNASEVGNTRNAMVAMRQVFDRTRSDYQQAGAVDTKVRRAASAIAQFGAFQALAAKEQMMKQTLPGMAVYATRIGRQALKDPAIMGTHMKALRGIASFDQNMRDTLYRAAPAVAARGTDGDASLRTKTAKEIMTRYDNGELEGFDKAIRGLANGKKHAVAAMQSYFRQALEITTGKPDAMLTRAIWFTEYANLEMKRTGGTFESVFADPTVFNAKNALAAQVAAEEIMAISDSSHRGTLLQGSSSAVGEVAKAVVRAFGNHQVSMWSSAQAQAQIALRSNNPAEKMEAVGKVGEIVLQNLVFRNLAAAVRTLVVATMVGMMLGLEDDEVDELYRGYLKNGIIGETTGFTPQIPIVGQVLSDREAQPIEDWGDWRAKYLWRSLMDQAVVLPVGYLSLPIVNDGVTPAFAEIMESGILKSDKGYHTSGDIETLTRHMGYFGVAAGGAYKYAEKEREMLDPVDTPVRAASFVLMLRGMRGRMLQEMSGKSGEYKSPYAR